MRAWVLVTGAASGLNEREQAAARLLGALLGREGYGLIAGTWGGVDELVTSEFLKRCPAAEQPRRMVHVINNPVGSSHRLRVAGARCIASSSEATYSQDAVELADVGVVVSGRDGSKPSMDQLSFRGKGVVPLAWLGNDAFHMLQDLLRERGAGPEERSKRRALLPLADHPDAAGDLSRRCSEAQRRPLGLGRCDAQSTARSDVGRSRG